VKQYPETYGRCIFVAAETGNDNKAFPFKVRIALCLLTCDSPIVNTSNISKVTQSESANYTASLNDCFMFRSVSFNI
jgi:hypothetical protein